MRVKKITIIAGLILIAFCVATTPVLYAAEFHENPALAKQIFSGISLLNYYSNSLDLMIQKNLGGTETYLNKEPFVNIPKDLEEATKGFASSGKTFSRLLVNISQNCEKQNTLIGQFRLVEAAKLAEQISTELPKAYSELDELEKNVKGTGEYLRISSVTPQSEMRRTYNEVLDKIRRLREMLDRLAENLDLSMKLESMAQLFRSTNLTLDVNPKVAFVGDEIAFKGTLTSQDKPLGKREIEILLNNSSYATATTDAYGNYQGNLLLPYWYIHELEIQAIYHPVNEDLSRFITTSSPVVKVILQYYESSLEVKLSGPAYPGKEAALIGSFDYGQSPPIEQRKAELYLDDVLVAQFNARQKFTQELTIESQTSLGKHMLTVSAPAAGRYSPATASCILEVVRANPILDLNTPRIAIIPGNIGLSGRLYSEVGSLENASVEIAIDESKAQVVTLSDGSFEADVRMGMGLSLLGSQMITIRVQPQEPWNSPLTTTRGMFMINGLSCGIIIAMLIFLGIYLPRRFRVLYLTRPARTAEQREAKPTPVVVYQEKATLSSSAKVTTPSTEVESISSHGEPASVMLDLYRRVLRLVQRLTSMVLKPQQTLREYARDNSRALGPASKYFLQLTYIIERLIYGIYKPADADVERGVALSQAIKEETKSESI